MSYLLTSQLQIQTNDSSGAVANPSVNYSTRIVSTQAGVQPGFQRYTVGSTPVQLMLGNQLLSGGALPYVLPSGGPVPRIRFINTSAQYSVSVRYGGWLSQNPNTGPVATPTQLFLGPGFIQDVCFQQVGNTPTILLAPCETGYVGAVSCSDSAQAIVDVLLL